MADPQPPKTSGSSAAVPGDIRQRFPELIELILKSESMNDEERQYWIGILPVMTPEQIQSLKEILENEKKQLQAIDEKYAKEIEKVGSAQALQQMEAERTVRREQRKKKEDTHREEEEKATEDILKKIEQ